MKQDLREYSDNELSLLVFNDETLYKLRRQFLIGTELLDDMFLYTNEQLETLIEDIKQDLEEEA